MSATGHWHRKDDARVSSIRPARSDGWRGRIRVHLNHPGGMMTLQAIMAGPDGRDVTAYKRSRAQVRAGDWLPELGAYAVTDAIADPDGGKHWVTLDDGRDLAVATRRVWLWRRYTLAGWQADAVASYRDARDAWRALRESGDPIPAGAVAGTAGANIGAYQLTDAEFAEAYPPPRLADFLRDAADARREVSA